VERSAEGSGRSGEEAVEADDCRSGVIAGVNCEWEGEPIKPIESAGPITCPVEGESVVGIYETGAKEIVE
jgi:hypothetical protein